MKYAVLFYETQTDFDARSGPNAEAHHGAWMSYIGSMAKAGVMQAGSGLQPPSTGATVRLADGKRKVQDGPFADTKEQLAGFVLIDVPDLDAALEWAARAPCAGTGCVEVRPTLPDSN
jgi:hypothetical protein